MNSFLSIIIYHLSGTPKCHTEFQSFGKKILDFLIHFAILLKCFPGSMPLESDFLKLPPLQRYFFHKVALDVQFINFFI